MKVLLDECVPQKFRFSLETHGFEVQTVRYAGLGSYKNGRLLRVAENLFDVLVTLDQSIEYQNNFAEKKIAVLIVRSRSSRLSDLLPLVPVIVDALRGISPGQVVYVGHGTSFDSAERNLVPR